MKSDIYIFTGGKLNAEILTYLDLTDKLIIGVDGGIDWLIEQNIIPDYLVGDFDSIQDFTLEMIKEKYADRVHMFKSEKDETDTELSVRLAISEEPNAITILGGTGSRLDHVLANINVLLQAERKNIDINILDTNNRIQLLLPNKVKEIVKSNFKYVSLLPFNENVRGINISGFKYPLKDGEMSIGTPYGISNELVAERGTIMINEGILLIIESKD